jgi:DNA-binding transcriptional ArsR family regulator
MALPPFMKHLRVLEDAGLIRSEKQERVQTCSVRLDAFDELGTCFHGRRRLWRVKLDRLETQLIAH